MMANGMVKVCKCCQLQPTRNLRTNQMSKILDDGMCEDCHEVAPHYGITPEELCTRCSNSVPLRKECIEAKLILQGVAAQKFLPENYWVGRFRTGVRCGETFACSSLW